jgi:predicted AAA+ superfamily ATPase
MEFGKMYPRLLNLQNVNSSIFLFGPRGTGKTSWIKTHLSDSLYLDLLHTETYNKLLANSSRLENMIPNGFKKWIIIDEVHRLIESLHYKFILTGSSARSLKRKGVNLLAGRAIRFNMHPLTQAEVMKDFNLKRSLQYGLLPAAVNANEPLLYLETYISTYLREEVLQEGLTRNIAEFARFLETASFSQGAVLNYSEIAREAALERKTVANYFDILEDLLIGFRLFPFTKRAKRRLIQTPKFYLFDTGVFKTLRPMGPLDSPEEAEGPGLETLFLQHLRAYNDYFRWGYNIYYWRTSNQTEVDFILYGKRGLHAVEIKRKRNLHQTDLAGLRAFSNDYPLAKLYLIYGGENIEYVDNIKIIPIDKMLSKLIEIL